MLGAVDFCMEPYSVLSGVVLGIFTITVSTKYYNFFHSYKTYRRRVLVYFVM